MEKASRSPLVAILTVAWVLASPVSLLFSQQIYSRSRWIAAGMRRGVRFSGGIVAGGLTPELAALRSSGGEGPRQGRSGIPPGLYDTRVSFDILPPDNSSGAEPYTMAEPSLAADPGDGNRLIALYQEDRFNEGGGARALTYALSTDGGRNWREGLLPNLTAAAGGSLARASDPWVTFGAAHRAVAAGLAFNDSDTAGGVFASVSNDGGQTWADPVAVHQQTSDEIDDKDAVAVDDNPRSPYFGRIYVGWDMSPNDPSLPQTLVMAHSADNGASFSPPAKIYAAGGNLGILPLVDASGMVHAIWLHYQGGGADNPNASIDSSYSTDGGDTWSAPVKAADVFSVPVPHNRTAGGLPAAVIDPASGRLLVVWEDQRFTPGTDQVLLTSSSDGGSHWSAPQRISDGPDGAANFTPAVAVNTIGQVAVSYYSFRNDSQGTNLLADEYMTIGGPGAQPFSRSRRQSTTSWDMRFAAIAGGELFLGDYQAMAPSGKTFSPLWVATFAPSILAPAASQPDVYTVGRALAKDSPP